MTPEEKIKNLESALATIRGLAEWHADMDADPLDTSPEDAVLHMNGLICQTVDKALGGKSAHHDAEAKNMMPWPEGNIERQRERQALGEKEGG